MVTTNSHSAPISNLTPKHPQDLEASKQPQLNLLETTHIPSSQHADSLTAMLHLASILLQERRFPEAASLYKKALSTQIKALKIAKNVYGEEAEETLACSQELAVTYWKRGFGDGAVAVMEGVMEAGERRGYGMAQEARVRVEEWRGERKGRGTKLASGVSLGV